MDDSKSQTTGQSKLRYGCNLCTDFKPSSRNFNAERHVWVQHVRDSHPTHSRAPYEPFLFKHFVKDHVVIARPPPDEGNAGDGVCHAWEFAPLRRRHVHVESEQQRKEEDAPRTTHLRWVDMTDSITQSGAQVGQGLSTASSGNSAPEDGSESRRNLWHPYARSPSLTGSTSHSHASPLHNASHGRKLSRSLDDSAGGRFLDESGNRLASRGHSNGASVHDLYLRRPTMRDDEPRGYHRPDARRSSMQRDMPFRDRGQPLMRPLQRDMAIDPNRGRMVEPTRYLQRPMLPPPHHFDQRYSDGYAHGYPRDGPDLESSQHYGGADKWRWDARGPPIDPVEDERGRREGWSGPYGSHRAGRSSGASARIHRELQRDMPPTSSRLYTAGGFYGGRAGPSEEGLAMRTAPLRPANRRYTHPAYDSEGDKHPHGIPSAGATQFPSAGYGDNAGSDLYSNSQSSSGVTNSSSSDALRHQKPQ